VVAGAVVLGALIPRDPSPALGVGAFLLLLGVVLAAPALLLAAVFATVFAPWRVGPGALQMSICDAITVLALLAALPYVPWHKRPLRVILAALCFYLALLFVVVVSHPTQRAVFEYFHRSVLFGGTAVIGAAVANRNQVKSALKALVFASAVVAVAAIYYSLAHGLSPAYPFGFSGINKNLAGSLLAIVIILLIVAPGRVGLRMSVIRHIRVLCILGLLATQARGAGLALVAAIAIYAVRHRSARQRAPIFFLTVAIVLIGVSIVTLRSEYINNPKFNAIDQRTTSFTAAINNEWLPHPITGAGLRWFQANDTGNYIASGVHNIVIAELSEGGLIALVGLAVLLGITLRVLRRRRDPLGEAAFLILVCQILFGMTDVFWVAGSFSLAMLMVGLAVGEDTNSVEFSRSGKLSPTA
jgi:hypothetical protein